jgi:cation transport ATPase
VVEVMAAGNPLTQDDFLRLVASAEQSSEHPLAQAVVEMARAMNRTLEAADEIQPL